MLESDEQGPLTELANAHYQEGDFAYCKYCYTTHDEWDIGSDSEVARRCGVSHTFVSKLREENLSCNVARYDSPVRL